MKSAGSEPLVVRRFLRQRRPMFALTPRATKNSVSRRMTRSAKSRFMHCYCEYCLRTCAASNAPFAPGSFAWNIITVTAAEAVGARITLALPKVLEYPFMDHTRNFH